MAAQSIAARKGLLGLAEWLRSKRYPYKKYENDLDDILFYLQLVMSVVETVEKLHTMPSYTEAWLKNAKDVMLDADDTLDRINYKFLELLPVFKKGGKGKLIENVGMLAVFSHPIRHELGYLVKKFKSLSKRFRLYEIQTQSQSRDDLSWRETISRDCGTYRDKLEIIGRSAEIEEVISCMKTKSGFYKYSVTSLVGLGGVGKTTIARAVLKKMLDGKEFDVTCWVHIGDTFCIKDIQLALLNSCQHQNSPPFAVASDLGYALENKKFLFIFDDMYDITKAHWQSLCDVFGNGKIGSSILVTTRSHSVAEMIEGNICSINVLTRGDFSQLFKYCCFRGTSVDDYTRDSLWEDAGIEIADKLGGLPLAAVQVGNMLGGNHDFTYWQSVLHEKIWAQEDHIIMNTLKLSYQNLSGEMKRCFLLLGLFPKGYKFYADILIRYWVSLGYIEGEHRLERICKLESYVNQLVSRSLLMDMGSYYQLHDLVHDLATLISGEHNFRATDKKIKSTIEIPDNCNHLMINSHLLEVAEFPRKLKTLYVKVCSTMRWSADLVKQLMGVRVLIFDNSEGNPDCKLPSRLNEMCYIKCLHLINVFDPNLRNLTKKMYCLEFLKSDSDDKVENLGDCNTSVEG